MPELKSNWRRGFWSLIATQFQGAFNENALKFLTIYLILALVKDNAQRDRLEFLVGVLFAAPFIFFSLSQSKRPQYILPLMPAIALLVAPLVLSWCWWC